MPLQYDMITIAYINVYFELMVGLSHSKIELDTPAFHKKYSISQSMIVSFNIFLFSLTGYWINHRCYGLTPSHFNKVDTPSNVSVQPNFKMVLLQLLSLWPLIFFLPSPTLRIEYTIKHYFFKEKQAIQQQVNVGRLLSCTKIIPGIYDLYLLNICILHVPRA